MLAVQQQCAALLQLQYMLCICRTACSAEADALKCFVVQLNPHFTRLFNSGAGEPPQAQAAGSSGKGRLARLRCTSPLMLLSLHLSHVAVACGSSSPAHLCIGASCCTLGAHAACQCFCQSQMLNVTLNTAQRVLLHQVQQHLIADMVFSWLVPQARLTTRRPWRSAAASAPPARAAPPPRPALALCRPGPTTTATVPPPPPAATAAMAANTPCRQNGHGGGAGTGGWHPGGVGVDAGGGSGFPPRHCLIAGQHNSSMHTPQPSGATAASAAATACRRVIRASARLCAKHRRM